MRRHLSVLLTLLSCSGDGVEIDPEADDVVTTLHPAEGWEVTDIALFFS